MSVSWLSPDLDRGASTHRARRGKKRCLWLGVPLNNPRSFLRLQPYLSGCRKHSNWCHSFQPDSNGHNCFQQHEDQNLCDKSDTGHASGQCSVCRRRHKARRFPANEQQQTLFYRAHTKECFVKDVSLVKSICTQFLSSIIQLLALSFHPRCVLRAVFFNPGPQGTLFCMF